MVNAADRQSQNVPKISIDGLDRRKSISPNRMADKPPAERKPSSRSQLRRPSYREALGAAVSKKVLGKEARNRAAAEEEKKKK